MLQIGEQVLFDVVVENTSAVDSITVDSVVDDVFGDLATACLPALPTTIAPGATIVCSYRHQVTGAQAPRLTNTVSVSGVDDDAELVSGAASAAVEVAAVVDIELTVLATNVAVGDQADWRVVVANRGPASASGVRILLDLPEGTTFVSEHCVVYDGGLQRAECEYNAATRIAELQAIPSGAAVSLTVTTDTNAVGSFEFRAELIGIAQPDVDSRPADARGDDIDVLPVLITVERQDAADGSAGSVGLAPGTSLPMWPLAAAAAVVVAAALFAWRPWSWRIR